MQQLKEDVVILDENEEILFRIIPKFKINNMYILISNN